MSFDWAQVADILRRFVMDDAKKPVLVQKLDEGQRASLIWIAERLPHSGVVLADEVGTGKTRIACAVIQAVISAGGRAAAVVPHGLMHQWQYEAGVLGMARAKEFTSLGGFVEDARSKAWQEIAPSPDNSEWLLVSHQFRTPQVKKCSVATEWRVALPTYVRALLSTEAARKDRRTHFGKLFADPHQTTLQIAEAIVRRIEGGEPIRDRASLDRLPPYRCDGDNDKLIEMLQKEEGRKLVEDLLGIWLGAFELLVIDEAHKSRGEMDGDGTATGAASATVLSRLVSLLKQTNNGRRLCLTATPMELEFSQWLDLLKRARSGLEEGHGKTVIDRLHYAARQAAIAPDEGERLDELCAAARAFTAALAPHVTRRRRDDDPLIARFRGCAGLSEGLPHPHRRLQQISIPWTEATERDSPWVDVLFAAECMSQSARGLKQSDTANWPRAVRDAYTKLAAGHVSIDLSEVDEPFSVPDPGVADDYTRGKIARVAYWYKRLRAGRKRVMDRAEMLDGAPLDPDAEHPRILAAAKEIESWTLKQEKVLVFGVFLRPLRFLRDVLNVRHSLRAADAGRPIAHSIHTDEGLYSIAVRHLGRLRADGTISDRLLTCSNSELRRVLADCHRAYERLRDKVRRRAKHMVATWRNDSSMFRGVLVSDGLKDALEDHFVAFVLDDFLATTSESDEVTADRLSALSAEFVDERIRPLLGEGGEENDEGRQAKPWQKGLQSLVEDEDGRQSFHARLLQGVTKWATRRYIQAAFNRSRTAPWVLIAQSQVGREGLNLHKACRVVLQFHAEWNPAVVEQQIGRVDRKGSLWEQRAQEWLADGAQGEPPFIEVRQLVFEGTYDSFQWDRVMRRQHVFDASLFGSLLPADAWDRIPQGREAEVIDAAPSFRPPAISGS